MNLHIIQLWGRRLCTRGEIAQHFLILLEQGIDNRDNLACNSTNDFASTCISTCALIIATLDWNEALVNASPFTIHLDRSPDNQVHHLLGLARSTWRETGTVQGGSRLG